MSALVFFVTTAFAGGFEGPLVIKNGYPLYAALGSPSLTQAEPENSVAVNFSYSSTCSIKRAGSWYYGIDLETAVTDIRLRRTVGENTELGIEVPIIRYGPGFMDGAIESYHDLIGLHNAYGRNDRPRDRFLLLVTHDGKTVILGEPGKTALGDATAEVKRKIYDDHASTSISAQAFVNVPTGDPDSAYGSGNMNGGFAALMNEKLREDLMLYVNAGIGIIDGLKAMQEVPLRDYYYGGVGLEWLYSKKTSLDAQVFVQTSPFPKSGISFIDEPSMLGSFGGIYAIDSGSTLGISVTEDPDTSGAPDITVGAEYRYAF
jgi:Protein of unknown function (DUF3187)